MDLKKYEYKIGDSFFDYKFESVGPKGRIAKIVRFVRINNNAFNLVLGDEGEEVNKIDDQVVTGNNDGQEVMLTVASIIFDFLSNYSTAQILIVGNSESRNRLYRMMISKYLSVIPIELGVQGFNNGHFEPFRINNNYKAFMAHRKNRISLKKWKIQGIIDPTVPNYENHPAVIRKTEMVNQLIKEYNLLEKMEEVTKSRNLQRNLKVKSQFE